MRRKPFNLSACNAQAGHRNKHSTALGLLRISRLYSQGATGVLSGGTTGANPSANTSGCGSALRPLPPHRQHVFLRLADGLPACLPYDERVLLSLMDREPDVTDYSQRKAYDTVFDELRKALAETLKKGSKQLPAICLQTLLRRP